MKPDRLELRERLSEEDPDFACLEDAIGFLEHLGEHDVAMALCDIPAKRPTTSRAARRVRHVLASLPAALPFRCLRRLD